MKRILFLLAALLTAAPAYAGMAPENPGHTKPEMMVSFAPQPGITSDTLADAGVEMTPYQDSQAYQQYLRRPKSELSKILYLLDRLKKSNYTILYNNKPYEPNMICMLVKQYILFNYKKETAPDWLQKHAYRSRSKGIVIQLKDRRGELQPLRDLLLEELNLIEDQVTAVKSV